MVLMILLSFCFHLDLSPQHTFVLIGSVRDTSGQAVNVVRVSVMDENMLPVQTLMVDSAGRFKVAGLRIGTYLVRIETTGTPYQEQTQRIELTFGGTNRRSEEPYPIDFVLSVKKGKEDFARKEGVFVQTVPDAARAEYDHAVKSLKSNKTDQAISSLKKAIEAFPDYYDALELLGVEYTKGAQYELALPLLTHALEINKRGVKSLYSLGVAHLNLNQLPEAVKLLEKSAGLEPNNSNTQMMLGLAYGSSQLLDKAEAAFRKALQISGPAAADAHFYLAGLYNKQANYRKARQELEAYLKESKNVKDPAQIKAMIEKFREKERTPSAGQPQPESKPISPGNQSPTLDQATLDGESSEKTSGDPAVPLVDPAALPAKSDDNPPEPGLIHPLPAALPAEIAALIEQSKAAGTAIHRRLLDYTYRLKKTHRVLDERGKPGQTREQVFEAYPVKGEHVLILLSTDGVSSRRVADDRKRAVKELEHAESRPTTGARAEKEEGSEGEGYVSAGIMGIYDGKAGYLSINISAFMRYCEFFAPRTESIAGRPTVILKFRPRAGSKPPQNYSYVAKLVGEMWIDQTDQTLTRVEAWPVSAFDLISSAATDSEAALSYRQERQANGLWFPSLIRMNARGRTDLFNGLNWDVVFEFDNYRQFGTSSSEKIETPPNKNN